VSRTETFVWVNQFQEEREGVTGDKSSSHLTSSRTDLILNVEEVTEMVRNGH
jgi:hypothetical protein